MSEVSPAFTYSPDGLLIVTRGEIEVQQVSIGGCGVGVRADRIRETLRDAAMKTMAELPGVSVKDNEVAVPVAEALGQAIAERDEDKLDLFLRNVALLQPRMGQGIDRIVTTPQLSSCGVRAEISQHFQLWLNRSGLTEEAARGCLLAMALPFPSNITEAKVKEKFQYHSHSDGAFGAIEALKVRAGSANFGFEKFKERWRKTRKATGQGTWNELGLDVYGNGGCGIALNGNTRQKVRVDPETKMLYSMWAHNVDHSRQALSILLGLGSLAYHSANYGSHDNVLDGIKWHSSRRWDNPIPRAT